MTQHEFFEEQFPGAAHLLSHLRGRDPEFDRICHDFHEVFLELLRARRTQTRPHPRYLADLAESLSDLRTSIDEKLRCQHSRASRCPKSQ